MAIFSSTIKGTRVNFFGEQEVRELELWIVVSQEPGSSRVGKRTCKTFLFRVEMLAQEVHLFTKESKEQGLAPAVSKQSVPLMDDS